MAFHPRLRSLIDLITEANSEPWKISMSPMFQDTLSEKLRIFPDLKEKLQKFVDVKLENPISNRYGKHDSPFTGPLVGFWHAHLRDDAIIIYNLKNRSLHLVAIVSHAEIEGKRAKKMKNKLDQFK